MSELFIHIVRYKFFKIATFLKMQAYRHILFKFLAESLQHPTTPPEKNCTASFTPVPGDIPYPPLIFDP